MDPVALGPNQWGDLGTLLTSLWCVAGFVVFFAANMLVGHILIPSLVGSFHLPSIAQKARPVFYAVGLISIAGAAYELVLVIDLADVLETFWSDYWI